MISTKRATTYCQSKGNIPHFETSAKEATNVDEAFEGTSYADQHIYLGFAAYHSFPVIAKCALSQEQSEEYNNEFNDPINIHLDNERDSCAC